MRRLQWWVRGVSGACLGVVGLTGRVQSLQAQTTGQAAGQPAGPPAAPADTALAREVSTAPISLERGLAAAAAHGKAISAKYEAEGGHLQLSVYTAQGAKFSEVLVDPRSGRVLKTEPIDTGEDLTAATAQRAAMGTATRSLRVAVAHARAANAGYHAVSVMPALDHGVPTAMIVLARGATSKTVTEALH